MTAPKEEPQPVQGSKSFRYVAVEGLLYFCIGAFTPAINVLESDHPLDIRHLIALALSSLVAGAVALKAFMSQSMPPNDK